jgi:hypothetical protein
VLVSFGEKKPETLREVKMPLLRCNIMRLGYCTLQDKFTERGAVAVCPQ